MTPAIPGVRRVEHSFSVEMKSKRHVKSISISDEAHDRVLFEGNLGELVELSLVEGDVLEFIGVNGVLRIDLTEERIRKLLACKRRRSSLTSEVGSYTSTKKLGGENEMRTSSKVVGSLLFLTTIALLMVPVAYTTPPTEGVGTFNQVIEDTVEVRLAGKNMIMHSYGGGGYLIGIFEGVWIHDEWMVVHPNGKATVKGVWDTPYGVTFNAPGGPFSGTLHVRYIGTVEDLVTGKFHGQFVIISGTGELEYLRGQGTMWFDPDIDPNYAHSTIQYHFDPS